jgi:apolipoprotein N-acyltransferase
MTSDTEKSMRRFNFKFDYRLALDIFIAGFLPAIAQPTVVPGLGPNELEPYGFLSILAFFGWVPLLIRLRGCTKKRAFFSGFAAGMVYFFTSLYWINIAVNVYGHVPYYGSIPIVLMLCGFCAFFWGLSFQLAEYMRSECRQPLHLCWPFAVVALEYVRNYLFSGFPWSQLGYTQVKNIWLLQSASFFGIYGVTYLVVYVNAVLASTYAYLRGLMEPLPRKGLIVMALLIMGLHFYGYFRVQANDELVEAAPKLKLALLQVNVDQSKKLEAFTYREEIMGDLKRLAREADDTGVDLIIWPEASLPYTPHRDLDTLKKTRFGKKETRAWQVVGAPVYFSEQHGEELVHKLHNSAFLVQPDLKVVARNDKHHLVPFGEYVPLEKYIPVQKIVQGIGTFAPGETLTNFRFPGGRFGILICYEGIFPEISRELTMKGAEFLLNITNDAWYGVSSAPYQHLSMYSVRAVENRRFIARATNTGISAFIDPSGRWIKPSALFTQTVVYGEIAKLDAQTLYSQVGDFFCWIALAVTIFTIGRTLLGLRRRESGWTAKS